MQCFLQPVTQCSASRNQLLSVASRNQLLSVASRSQLLTVASRSQLLIVASRTVLLFVLIVLADCCPRCPRGRNNNIILVGGRWHPVVVMPLGSPTAIPLTTRHRTVIGVHTRLHYAEYLHTVRYMLHVHRQLPKQSPGLNGPVWLRASGTQCTVVSSVLP